MSFTCKNIHYGILHVVGLLQAESFSSKNNSLLFFLSLSCLCFNSFENFLIFLPILIHSSILDIVYLFRVEYFSSKKNPPQFFSLRWLYFCSSKSFVIEMLVFSQLYDFLDFFWQLWTILVFLMWSVYFVLNSFQQCMCRYGISVFGALTNFCIFFLLILTHSHILNDICPIYPMLEYFSLKKKFSFFLLLWCFRNFKAFLNIFLTILTFWMLFVYSMLIFYLPPNVFGAVVLVFSKL